MDREALSNDLKEMVEAVSRLIEIAFGMRVSEDTKNPTMITVKGLGNIKTLVSLLVSHLFLFELLFVLGPSLKYYCINCRIWKVTRHTLLVLKMATGKWIRKQLLKLKVHLFD